MFQTVVCKVCLNDNVSDGVTIEAGLPQGSVLSPLLYDVLKGLYNVLVEAGLGTMVHGRLVSC